MNAENSNWRGHRVELLKYLGRRVDDAALREDIVQEAFARLFTYQARRDGVINNLPAYLRRITINLLRDHQRAARRFPIAGEVPETLACPVPSVESALDFRQRVEILVAALDRMPPLRREIFLRNRFDEQPASDIAEELEMSRAAVDKHIVRALADLRGRLEKQGLALWRKGR